MYDDIVIRGFRPLIRGFFFYFLFQSYDTPIAMTGFRPLIRGFFFYLESHKQMWQECLVFPSPHSGILFLSCRYDMPPSLNIFAIFRRILHLLAQKGFPLTQSIHFSPYPSASARINFFSPILYRFQFLLINILSHRLLLYHLYPTILLLYGHREYKYAMNLAPHL